MRTKVLSIIVVLAFCFSLAALAGPPLASPVRAASTWEKTFGGTMDDIMYAVRPTSDGGFIATGVTNTYDQSKPYVELADYGDVWLLKADSQGNEQWEKTFSSGNNLDVGYDVQQTDDGGYVITGWYNSLGVTPGVSYTDTGDVWLIKTDAQGNEQWNRTFGGGGLDIGKSVRQTADGGYIIACDTKSFGAGYCDAMLIKIDASGIEQWQRTYGGWDGDYSCSVQQTSDGGYMFVGATCSYGAGMYDAWLVKTDASGNEQWDKTFGGSSPDVGSSLSATTDGGYVIAGITFSYGVGGDMWLIKIDSSGTEQWERTYGGAGEDVGRFACQTSDGGYMVIGYTNSFGSEGRDAYLLKTDSMGNEVWHTTVGGTGDDIALSVAQTGDGSYVLGGSTMSSGAGGADGWLVKVGAESEAPTGLLKISPDNNPLPAFKWNEVVDAVSYEIQVDAGAWIDIGNRLTYVQPSILSKGSHTLSVRAKDTFGNTGQVATLNFNVSVVADLANTKLATNQGRELSSSEIYSMDIDFSNQINLTNNSATDDGAAWSPDGTKLAFYSERDGNREIYIMNADGSAQTRITQNTASDSVPCWSPDGTKIAFESNRDSNSQIYTMNADGSGQTRLTNNTAMDAYPAWSPDGTKIAFQSNRDGNWKIYTMNADGSGQTRLTSNPEGDWVPAWCPNGSKILYAATQNGENVVRVMNTDGSNQTDITQIRPYVLYSVPRWSPDGSKIVLNYAETVSDWWTVATMNADGSALNVLDSNRPWGYPSWSPFLGGGSTGEPVGRVVLTQPLNITPSGPYSVGDTLTANFTVENKGDAPITLDKLLLGGRYNGGELPGGGYPDFTYETVTLQTGESHQYQGTFTIPEPGEYGFFIAYYIENPTEAERQFLDENNWNTCIELGEGLTDADRTRQIIVTLASPVYTVYATREGLVGQTTANGHVIQTRDHFVALPSTKALCSNGGTEYEVRITYAGKSVVAPVWDVGPWNTRDDYWNSPSQRDMWQDLAQGMPEAQAAYQNGYNDGEDQFGRTVTNPAGIDLADGTFWDDLGMTDNDWVQVEFLFLSAGPVPSDTTPPNTEITNGFSGTIYRDYLTIEWTGYDDVTPSSELEYSFYLENHDLTWSGWLPFTSMPYSNLPDGSYTFKVKARDKASNEDPTPAEMSFAVLTYAPNPYGYDFNNTSVLEDNPHTMSNEGMSELAKWYIFMSTFDLSGVDPTTVEYWYHKMTFGEGGNCYGMAASSLMEYVYPQYDLFLENQTKAYLFELDEPSIDQWYWSSQEHDSGWDGSADITDMPVLRHMVGFQISQVGILENAKVVGTANVLSTLESGLPNEMYILSIFGKVDGQPTGHALVPFRLETVTENQEYRVFVYDCNYHNDESRAVTFRKGLVGTWSWEYELWSGLTWSGPSLWGIFGDSSIKLTPISVAYNGGNKLTLPGTRATAEAEVILSGEANLTLFDQGGRQTGLSNGLILEEIPGVELIVPMGLSPDEQPVKWQPAFCISDDTDITFVVEGVSVGTEAFSLLKFGKDYLVEVSGLVGQNNVEIQISADGTRISICGQEDQYAVVANRNENGASRTFTATNIPSTSASIHQYSIDWAALSQGQKGVTLQIDSNGDGLFEQIITSDTTLEPPMAQAGGPYNGQEAYPVSLDASGSYDPDGTIVSYQWDFGDGSTATGITPTHTYGDSGVYTVTLAVTDDDGLTSPATASVTVVDTIAPEVMMLNPPSGWALQDEGAFRARATDAGAGVDYVTFTIREADAPDQAIGSGEYEDMAASYDAINDWWSLSFGTLDLPDGYYVVIVKATDKAGPANVGSITVPYSIRNWAVIELLPATENNKAGRTMPVKFSLRVAASVDPAQPFVYNEDLTIKIYATSNPGSILQTSTFGDTARDYRINTFSELYITNFPTLKTPKQYTVEIYRGTFLVGTFSFRTVK